MHSPQSFAISTVSRSAPRMPVPNRHVTGQGHHRTPPRSQARH